MSATSPNPLWVLNKKRILVYAPDFDVSCFTRLRIAYNKTTKQGSISLKIMADLANLTGRQALTLNISPEVVENCELARESNYDLCPTGLFSILPAPVSEVSAVSTLSLRLKHDETGIVLCPSGVETLIPANQGDLDFDAFANICRSKFLRLHISDRQFGNKELDQLETFSGALQERSLEAESFDHHPRHGVVRKDWHVFSRWLYPPPYCEEHEPDLVKKVDPPLYCEQFKQVVGKRRNGILSSSFRPFVLCYSIAHQ